MGAITDPPGHPGYGADVVRVTNPGYAEFLQTTTGKIITEQAQQIAALTAKVSDLEAAGIHTHNGDQCRHLSCVNERLTASLLVERGKLEAADDLAQKLWVDAARYRWLRDSEGAQTFVYDIVRDMAPMLSGNDLDAAIDAAMAAPADNPKHE